MEGEAPRAAAGGQVGRKYMQYVEVWVCLIHNYFMGQVTTGHEVPAGVRSYRTLGEAQRPGSMP